MKTLNLLIKPVSGNCNIDCTYCFYKEETAKRKEKLTKRMSPEIRKTLIRGALEAATDCCTFAFQGGEPTLAGLDYYRQFAQEAETYRKPGTEITYVLQTNGLLLDEEWLTFLKEKKFLVGLSLDGTRGIHDRYRKGYQGEDTFLRVMEVLDNITKAGIEYNVLTVLTGDAARRIDRIYQFYTKQGIKYQQYIPCLQPSDTQQNGPEYALTPQEYADAIKRLFDLWYMDYSNGNYVYIRQFENWVGALKGSTPEACAQSGCCGVQNVVEADGTVYPCDFYAADRYACGHVNDYNWNREYRLQQQKEWQAAGGGSFLRESALIREDSAERCRSCPYTKVCRGGCRRDYTLDRTDGWHNGFCEAYRSIFAHIWERLALL